MVPVDHPQETGSVAILVQTVAKLVQVMGPHFIRVRVFFCVPEIKLTHQLLFAMLSLTF